jgi:hypothetical protein
MEPARTKSLFLLMVSLTLMWAVSPSGAADASTVSPAPAAGDPAAPAVAATDDSSCTLKCPCGCSPLAGSWTAKFTSTKETTVTTFKLVPVNDDCTKFAVNVQVATRSAKVIKCWPDACDLTEFVGTACKGQWNDVQFTAIGYGVKRCNANAGDPSPSGDKDKVVFIAVMTGLIDLPGACLDCDQPPDGVCNEREEVPMTVFLSYFDAEQDLDRDGRPDPDCECSEAVVCVCFETKLQRIAVIEPCEESKSFVACLTPRSPAPTQASGRAFFRVRATENRIGFVLTDQGLKDVTKATIQVAGTEVVKLAESEDGDCTGLLACGYFYPKDFLGPWKGKSLNEIVKVIEAGQATVVVGTGLYPAGAISGKIEDL